MTSRFYTLV